MLHLTTLLNNNRAWAETQVTRDPEFFSRLCAIQRPNYLWIGCADSRVPANTIIGLDPGEVFVHRNVANVVSPYDRNCLAVVQYAVDVLKVTDIIVCGHYRCGGVQAALGPHTIEPLEGWLTPIRTLCSTHAHELATMSNETVKWDRLCELNVISQVRTLAQTPTLSDAWQRGQTVTIHGWIYDLHDGLIRDLDVSTESLIHK
jgi:carbonic anhydrase